ncbi:hypothetical protein [Puerhibacterium sp. TATVAM-FAB25]|uniref:hypothetical protein n=1 Tax=Puerhibacterium sp. TATVAM-FAB25 TaxID=3093699 RepID=UPI00397E712A
MTTERGLSMEQALERAVLLERLRRRRALRRAAPVAVAGQPAARAVRAAAPGDGEARAAD